MADKYLGTGNQKPGKYTQDNTRIDPLARTVLPGGIQQIQKPPTFQASAFGAKGTGYTESDAARWFTSKNVNPDDWKQQLYSAGYYRKNEIPIIGGPVTASDIEAMRRAMGDANLSGGTSIKKLLPTMAQAVANGARALYYGTSVSTRAAGGSGGAGGGGSSSGVTPPQKYINITAEKTAKDNLRAAMMSSLGRVPTQAEYNDYVSKLNANEKKYFRQTTYKADGSQVTTGVEFDRESFLSNYVLSKGQFKSDLAGKFGDIQDTVNQLINDNGINSSVTASQRAAWMKQLAEGADLNTIRSSIHSIATTAYDGFADLLQANPTMSLRDIASPYIASYANTLELDSNTVNLKDVLSKAIVGGKRMTVSEYEKSLRNDSRFQYTKAAKSEAVNAATSFARAFGVNV